MEKFKNVCFKSDGTKETGKKIIITLELIGGCNPNNIYDGESDMFVYYYINKSKTISNHRELPNGYTLANVDEVLAELTQPKEKPFPKWMMVGNRSDDKIRRFVTCFGNDAYWAVGEGKDLTVLENALIFPYLFADDIDENAEEIEAIEKQIAELTAKLNELKGK